MDSRVVSAPEAADVLGVSLPAIHRMLDAAGVPAYGRGKARLVPLSVLDAEVRAHGATPKRPPERTRPEMLLLTALARSPFGRDSAREVADLAGVSPTTASTSLERLLALQLVSHDEEKVARGRVRKLSRWRARPSAWDASLTEAVRTTTLPEQQRRDAGDTVPRRFHQLFWNAEPERLSIAKDGAYIAGRMLDADDVNAWTWALQHVANDDIRHALHRRGVTDRQRALVENWAKDANERGRIVVDEQPRERDGKFEPKTPRDPEVRLPDDVATIEHVLPGATARAWRALAPYVPTYAYLAGGTAIAVHLQHRISRDLDFFTEQPFVSGALVDVIDGAGDFAASRVDDGTITGVFEDTKVQFLDASTQRLVEQPSTFGGIRVAGLPDLLATKLKVIRDRGELRDYFDIMIIEQRTNLTVEEGLTLLVEKYHPRGAESVIAAVVQGLGYLGDVGHDDTLPATRNEIEKYWTRRQPQILRALR